MSNNKIEVYKKEITVIKQGEDVIHLCCSEDILNLIDELKSVFLNYRKEATSNE